MNHDGVHVGERLGDIEEGNIASYRSSPTPEISQPDAKAKELAGRRWWQLKL
jgi:hypothetical protein